MRDRSRWAVSVVFLLFIVVYVVPLGATPMGSPDETRYGEIPREMVESGEWIVPEFNGVRYFEKPPLGYWMTALSMSVLGESAFAVRFSSVASTGLTVLLIFFLSRRLFGQALPALLAAVIYATTWLVFVIGSIAILDAPLALCFTAAVGCFLLAFESENGRRRIRYLALAGIACGFGFLVKGFMAVVLPGMITAGWLLLSPRRWAILKLAWLPVLTAVATVAPWGLAIHRVENDFWRYFIWVEHVKRFLDAKESQHPEPFWFFLPVLFAALLVWLPLIPAAIRGYRGADRRSSWGMYVLLWFTVPLAFFSFSSGKLMTYILPCMAPAAMLIAWGIARFVERPHARVSHAATASSAIGLALVVAIVLFGRPAYGDNESWKWILLLFGAWSWSIIAWSARGLRGMRGVWVYACAPLLLMFSLHYVMPRALESGNNYERFFEDNASQIGSLALVVTGPKSFHAACWFLKRDDLSIIAADSEMTYGMGYADAAHRYLEVDELRALVESPERVEDLVILLADETYNGHQLADWARPDHVILGDGLALVRYAAAKSPEHRSMALVSGADASFEPVASSRPVGGSGAGASVQ